MTDTDQLIARLTELGEKRIDLQRDEAQAFDDIADLAIVAHKAGAQKIAIARAAQISRPTLDAILRAHEANANRRKR